MTKNVEKLFLDFFKKNGHEILNSSSVIPQDPTLLFANAGMVQFKDWFLDVKKAEFKNVTTSQNCIRAGGKHNDLDNVGRTNRHHTYFKMLGNFSFGGYFKEDAIRYAWDFLTNVLQLNKEKLFATHYHTDNEARKIWSKYLPDDRIISIDTEDNFWSMGDVGPCGPCSEIFYDLGEDVDVMGGNLTGGVGVSDRWIEIWNLVFMQFNKKQDGQLEELSQKCVDTGASVERLTAILENENDTYKTTIFNEIIRQIPQERNENSEVCLRVIADHTRCISQMIKDKVEFSNEGRGYVARKILRRAMNFWIKLFGNLDKFENLVILKDVISELKPEIESYNSVLKHNIPKLKTLIKDAQNNMISGAKIFELHDTFGLHVHLIDEYLADNYPDIYYDKSEFNCLFEEQKSKAQKAQNFELKNLLLQESSSLKPTKFIEMEGHTYADKVDNAKLLKIVGFDKDFYLIFDKTIAYAESGGQVSDDKVLISDVGYCDEIIKVNDVIFHKVNKKPNAQHFSIELISKEERQKTRINHTATHLLHSVLMQMYNATQKGSLVNSQKLRLDFNCQHRLSEEDIFNIENEVLKLIHKSLNVTRKIIRKNDIQNEKGLVALFDEKYGEEVRVISVEDGEDLFSKELCCGTHILNTSEIEHFKITSCDTVSKGVFRIEATTGHLAKKQILNEEKEKSEIKKHYKLSDFSGVLEKIKKVEKDLKNIQKEKEVLEIQIHTSTVKSTSSVINGIDFMHCELKNTNLRNIGMQITGEAGKKLICISDPVNSGFFIGKTSDLDLDLHKIFEKLKNHAKIKCGFSPKVIQGTLNGFEFRILTQEILDILKC